MPEIFQADPRAVLLKVVANLRTKPDSAHLKGLKGSHLSGLPEMEGKCISLSDLRFCAFLITSERINQIY